MLCSNDYLKNKKINGSTIQGSFVAFWKLNAELMGKTTCLRISVLKDLSHDVFEAGDSLISEVPRVSLTVPLSLLVPGFPSSLAPRLQVIRSVAEACVSPQSF